MDPMDADWAGDPISRKSTSGYCSFLIYYIRSHCSLSDWLEQISSVRTGFSTGRTEEICEEICHFRLYEPGAVGTIRLYEIYPESKSPGTNLDFREERQEREREGKRRGSLVLEPVERFSSDDAVRRFVYLAVRAREQEIGIDPDLQFFLSFDR
ncbi:hypothetical protein KFK09_011470 [Dendrobium nobile]|uniref:Uncharacterized protein n=1 Tax=Dendrobium nobile TaxID=94219 RepID=A0A8T3BF09_DENNO|nr:hypothetical protein KFK09_011470 [Dendrobium nobile]